MKKLSMKLMLLLVLVTAGVVFSPKQESLAAVGAVEVCAVSYTDESILVFTNENTKIYFGTEIDVARNNWDVIEVGTDKIAVIDISWLSSNVENILIIKGDKVGTQSRVIINKKPQKLEVSINYSQLDSLAPNANIGPILNVMSSEGTATNPLNFDDLQWKKGDDGRWLSSGLLTKRVLENYLIRGTNLYFRVAPVDDIVSASTDIREKVKNFPYDYIDFSTLTTKTYFPDGSKGRRASSEVKLKIAKQATLPVTGVDGEKFTVNIKYGQEYRVKDNSGSIITDWTKVTDRAIKKLPLSTMIQGARDGLTAAKAFQEMLIEIRNYSTSKASSSKIIETRLNAQRILPGTIVSGAAPSDITASDMNNIYISYNGTKNINIQIPSATVDNPYEYCVVKEGDSFDLNRASWTTISKGTIVKILSTKAVDKSTLYIRQQEIKYKAASATKSAVAFKLASTMGTFKVHYPSIPTTEKKTYVFTKGYTTALTIDVTLNVKGKLPFETGLKYIKLGTKDVPVVGVPTINPSISGGIDPDTVYTMRITLDSNALKNMTNCTARALSIYYNNGTVDKTSAKLTIKNPTDALSIVTKAPEVGSADGTTRVFLVSATGVDNHLIYEITADQVTGKKMEEKFEGTKVFTDGMDIAIVADKWLTIYELDKDNYIMKYKSIQIKAADIKQP